MNSKPTFKEFFLIKHDAIIKSSDGHFYIRRDLQRAETVRIAMFLVNFVLIIAFNSLLAQNTFWKNIGFDFAFITFLLYFVFYRIQYRHTAYVIVDDTFDDNEMFRDPPKTANIKKYYIYMILFSVVALFILLNSYSVIYLKSLINNAPPVFSLEIDNEYNYDTLATPVNNADDSIIDVALDSGILIEMETAQTADSITVAIDNVTIPFYYQELKPSWFWEPEYFHRSCEYYIDTYGDNSILEISSGSFTRKWTIKITS